MLVALKAVPRALCGVCGEWLRVYCVLRPLRGSVSGFKVKDDRLYILVLIGLFRGFKTLNVLKRPPMVSRRYFHLINLVLSLSLGFV